MVSQRDTTFTKIFVGGLPYHTTDDTLRKFFERFGDIEEAVVITDRATGKSRGYGFVTMGSKDAAQEAIKDPNPVIDGRKANVNLAYLGAKPRTAINSLHNVAANNTLLHLGGYPTIQTYGLQPSIIYPANTLFGSNVIPFGGGASAGLNQAQHYTTAYDLAQFGTTSQLTDTSAVNGYPYGATANTQTNQNALANAAAIAQLANANSYYAALASQALNSGAPSALAAFQQ